MLTETPPPRRHLAVVVHHHGRYSRGRKKLSSICAPTREKRKRRKVAVDPHVTAAVETPPDRVVALACQIGAYSYNGLGAKWIGCGAVVVWSAAVEPELTVLGAYGWSIGNEVGVKPFKS
ncbi:hypothetical protein PIB30_087832 [Stylosanthes scabra]|uniref:Uncharacterized protein n=1 Tax=Stylosanthes scabra TaxID=79078 RepID=A0ABU6RTF6_9FABA|nr:hypothetical protein [Stylosanthes scabra]